MACDRGDQPKLTHITIGTGGLTGVYYPTGQAIAKMINQKTDQHAIKALSESTAGSVYNINNLVEGEMEFAIAQSDRAYQAWTGEKEWKKLGPQKKLRSLFALHAETLTLIASKESGIVRIQDLKGKRVNLGNLGSGQLGNAEDALRAFGISLKEIQAEYVKALEAPSLLQDGRLDAFFFMVGHPNGNIKEATNGRNPVKIIPITGPEVDLLILHRPYYSRSSVPMHHYPKALNQEEVRSFGVRANLLSSESVSEDLAYQLTKAVFSNLKEFKKLHPALGGLSQESMLEGLSAPLHPGAIKYYQEARIPIPRNLLPK